MTGTTLFVVRYSLCDDASASTLYGPIGDTASEAWEAFGRLAESRGLMLEWLELVDLTVGSRVSPPGNDDAATNDLFTAQDGEREADDDLVDWDSVAMYDTLVANEVDEQFRLEEVAER